MKIRQGFVSNSSSSSFIIAADGDGLKGKKTIEIDFSRLASVVIKTEEEWKQYWEDDYYCEPESEFIDHPDYARGKEALKSGKVLYFGKLYTDDVEDPINYLLAMRGIGEVEFNQDGAEVLDEGGF